MKIPRIYNIKNTHLRRLVMIPVIIVFIIVGIIVSIFFICRQSIIGAIESLLDCLEGTVIFIKAIAKCWKDK